MPRTIPKRQHPVNAGSSVSIYVIPILLVVNVPSRLMVKVLDPWTAVFMVVVAGALLWASRWFFRFSLQKYRSASS